MTALARVEAGRLLRHPLLWGGVALGALMIAPPIWPYRLVLPRESVLVQFASLPVAAGVLVAAHLATTRVRRDAVNELVDSAVHDEDERTLAMLVAILAPAAVTAALVALLLGVAAALGAVGPVEWAEAATAPALVAGGGTVGVLLGRLAPWRLAALFGVVALAIIQFVLTEVGSGGPGVASTIELLAPAVTTAAAPHDPAATLRPDGLHLLYLLGGAGVAASAATLVGRINARRLLGAAVALAVAAAAGMMQMRPPGQAQLTELLVRTSDPVDAGDCTTDATGATVCALPLFDGWQPAWARLVHSVRSPLTERGVQLPAVTVAQRAAPSQVAFETSRWYGPDDDEIREHLGIAWEAEHRTSESTVLLTAEWPRGSDASDPGGLDLALHVARQAVGLPAGFDYIRYEIDGSTGGTTTCSPVGQAREAVAIWLAAQAEPGVAGALRRAAAAQPYPGTPADPIDDGSGFEDVTASMSLSPGAVAALSPEWSKPGTHVALQMLGLPNGEILERLTDQWSRWTDARTPLRDLVQQFGVSSPPLAADLQQQLGGGSVGPDLEQFFRDTPLPAPELDATGTAVLDVDPRMTGAPMGCP